MKGNQRTPTGHRKNMQNLDEWGKIKKMNLILFTEVKEPVLSVVCSEREIPALVSLK